MNIIKFSHLSELTSSIESEAARLSTHPDQERSQHDPTTEKIRDLLENNRTLLTSWDSDESPHFLRSIIPLCKQDSSLYVYASIAARSIQSLEKNEAFDSFAALEQIHLPLCLKSVGAWVSHNKVPIKELGFSEKQLLKLAPYLTYLKLKDGELDSDDSLTNTSFSEEFIGNLLKRAHNLTHLVIQNSDITGTSLSQIPRPEKLRYLELRNCPKLNTDFSRFKALCGLMIYKCPVFDQDINCHDSLKTLKLCHCASMSGKLSNLPSLKSFRLDDCKSFRFNPLETPNLETLYLSQLPFLIKDLPLTNLKNLEIHNCFNFVGGLSGLEKLVSLKISKCDSIYHDLLPLSSLTTLEIRECEYFDQDFSRFPNLTRLLVSGCKRLKQSVKNLPQLRELTVTGCKSFPINLQKLPNLQSFSISQHTYFNCNLSSFSKLEYLQVSNCFHFNQLLQDLKHLKEVLISDSNKFNQSLSGLLLLQNLKISNCPNFQQDIPDLPALKSCEITNCASFQGNFSELSNIERLEVDFCPNFNIFDNDLHLPLILKLDNPSNIFPQFHRLPPNRKQFFFDQYSDLLNEIARKTTTKNESGFSVIDDWLTPPAQSLSYYLGFLELSQKLSTFPESFQFLSRTHFLQEPKGKKLLQEVWMRICERFPNFARGEEDLPELASFIREALSSEDLSRITDLLTWEYKMNQALPMTGKALRKIKRLIEKHPDTSQKILLALQTHPNLAEIEVAVREGDLNQDFPEKSIFFGMSVKKQAVFLYRAVVFREQAALSVSNQILKNAIENQEYEGNLLLLSIKLLQKTGIESSSMTIDRLSAIIASPTFSSELKKEACLALAAIDFNPKSKKRKQLLLHALAEANDPSVQRSIIDSLGKYLFISQEKEIERSLIQLSHQTDDEQVKISLAYTLSAIPSEDALKEALSIVNSPIWNQVDCASEYENLGRVGDYVMYPYKPPFHKSRNHMKRAIAERLVEMHRDSVSDLVKVQIVKWRSTPSQFPDIETIKSNIECIPENTRYLPFGLYLPSDTYVYRAISNRKGEKLGKAAVMDLLSKGMGSADLSNCEPDKGTWAKIGQVFASTNLSSLTPLYFNENGVLIAIPSETINELLMRNEVRYECESGINCISYQTIRIHHIRQLFMNTDRKEQIEKWVDRYLQGATGNKRLISTQKKIAIRQFLRKSGKPVSMQNKVTYFEPGPSWNDQVNQQVRELGLHPPTLEQIVRENVERQIIREILAKKITDPDLKECMRFASNVTPSTYSFSG